ncbi:alpha/beta-type small acid-soluble spore protein [Anaerotruncus rubiinfantis]|jgi:hypothetical protein|uniref:alpha/beta-type small acid-soluble spore protein n=1 Tax=Anaerotruncus rubiinfantis TaxID=1720200 RepID=UPI00189B3586|nr:alpha/beta-type small acid-soluble spore protein [Anaerotruncus rubiinfantis]
MSNSNSSSNRIVVPEAKEAMNRFKMEAANEVGVPLKQGYNGDLTSRQAGSIGGQMVKKMLPEQRFEFIRDKGVTHHDVRVITYRVHISIV